MNLTRMIWCRDDFEACAAEAMALTKPEQPAAPVVDLFTREVVR